MRSYTDFQNDPSSEKVTLCILEGTKHLQGFQVETGNVHKIARNGAIIVDIKLNGVALNLVESIADLDADSFFFDDEHIYIESANPNSRTLFYVLRQRFFYSDKGVSLPHDLQDGYEVYFEPGIESTSAFGVELDTTNEDLAAIEGSGNIAFTVNEFWQQNFDKINFDNQFVRLYSWSPTIEPSESKLIFTGIIESKSYKSDKISFKVKDLLYKLRTSFNLSDISELGLRNSPNMDSAKQRIIYGKVEGFLPVNLDSLLNGSYPIKGTVSLFNGSPQVVGTGTSFKSQLVPNDKLRINDVTYTVQSISSDTNLNLTSNFSGVNIGPLSAEVIPVINKSYINRKWLVSGHELSEPETTIRAGSTTQVLFVDSTKDFFKDDVLCIDYVTGTELVRVRDILNETVISLSQTTNIAYPDGTRIYRPCVQNVKMDDITLTYLEDYTIDSTTGILELNEDAELNRAPILEAKDRITVTTGDSVLVGTGTKFSNYLKPGHLVRPQSTDDWYQILSLTDTEITLTETYTGTSFVTSESLPEKTSISGLTDYRAEWKLYLSATATQLHNKWIKLYDSSGSVAIWFDIDNVGLEEPDHGCDRAIEITTIHTGNNPRTILSRISQKLSLDTEFEVEFEDEGLLIKSKTMGVRPVGRDPVDNDFNVFNRASNEQVLTLTADVADSLDQTGFYLYDSTGLVFFWYAIDNNIGAVMPDNNGYRSVKITTVNTDDDVGTVRTKTKAFIDAEGFSSANQGSNKLVVSGALSSASLVNIVEGSLETLNAGKSAYNLNSKYFKIPYHNGTACFWMNVDGQGSNPGISATTTTEVVLDSTLVEEDIFTELAEAIETHPNLDVDNTDNTILITDINSATLSNVLSVGTSGLTIVQAQVGISSNPDAGAVLQYKNFIFGDDSKFYLDVYGKTNSDGVLLKTAPEIILDILETAGFSEEFIDYDNFETANDYFKEELSFCIPELATDKATNLSFRDVINKVNASVLGILLQDNNFKMQYTQFKPSSKSLSYFDYTDMLDFEIEQTNKNIVRKTLCEYGFKEYEASVKGPSNQTATAESLSAQYVSGVSGSRTFTTYLVNEADAKRLANRWSFLLAQSSGVIKFSTSLVAIQLQVGAIIQLGHPKFYERFGGQSKVKLLMVEAVRKTSKGVEVVCVDLSNAFNRIAKICDSTLDYANSNDETRLIAGFYCDDNGSIDDDPNSFNTNLIW